jgi:endonuclease/exonuclease/phosphatase family metal-dependent hydrolase
MLLMAALQAHGEGAQRSGPNPTHPNAGVWQSRESCERLVADGERLQRPGQPTLRIGSWNIEWFPRGCAPEEDCPERATDIDWLACAIAWMEPDLLAVQEVVKGEQAPPAIEQLLERLDSLTGGDWELDLQACGGPGRQSVGFLWNRDRIRLDERIDLWQLNGAAQGPDTACAGYLRPGRLARARSTRQGGIDFAVVSVHLDSGRGRRDFRRRRQALDRLDAVRRAARDRLVGDRDLVVLGDFNIMGREAPVVSGREELQFLDRSLGPGLRRVPVAGCSRRSVSLIQVLVSPSVAVRGAATSVCGQSEQAVRRLSDHAPVVLDVRDVNADEASRRP